MALLTGPILTREVITIFRRKRTYLWIFFYLAILIFNVYDSWPGVSYGYYSDNPVFAMIRSSRRAASDILYIIILMIFIIMPSYMATTMTREKEENTLSSLAVTQLSAIDIIFGKIQVSAFYTAYLLLITTPIFGALYKLGGFTMNEIFQGYCVIFVVSLAMSLWAMFFSTLSSTSYKAITRTYVFFFIMMIGIGFASQAFYRAGLGHIFDSSYVNPFLSIHAIFYGKSGGYYSGNLSMSTFGSQDLIFGIFYRETLSVLGFYSAITLVFTLLIITFFRKLEHTWN